MDATSRRRVLAAIAGSASLGVAGCVGGIDSDSTGGDPSGGGSDASSDGASTDGETPDEAEYLDALSRDQASALRGAAVDRAGIYDHFRSLFSQRENVERITDATMDPLKSLLEATGITDRIEGDPPAGRL